MLLRMTSRWSQTGTFYETVGVMKRYTFLIKKNLSNVLVRHAYVLRNHHAGRIR